MTAAQHSRPGSEPGMLIVAHEWAAWARHRAATAQRARESGWSLRIAVMSAFDDVEDPPEFPRPAELVQLSGARGATNPREMWRLVRELRRVIAAQQTDVVELVTLKPILFGSLCVLTIRSRPRVVATFAGLGTFLEAALGRGSFATAPRSKASRAKHFAARVVLRQVLRMTRAVVLVENEEDAEALVDSRIVPWGTVTVGPGVGLSDEWFARHCVPGPVVIDERQPAEQPLRVVQIGRVIGSKGVFELVEAARLLRLRGWPLVPIELVGGLDIHNPSAISEATVRAWEAEGLVVWRGHVEPIEPVLERCDLVVLCSHREGRSRSLMEAQAMGRPVVATDVAGNRQVVRDGVTGTLVAPGDIEALADAIAAYGDPAFRGRHGEAAAHWAQEAFRAERFVDVWAGLTMPPSVR